MGVLQFVVNKSDKDKVDRTLKNVFQERTEIRNTIHSLRSGCRFELVVTMLANPSTI